MTILGPREAYRLWAPTYAAETPVSFLDEQLAGIMLDGLPREHLLDVGCGTGRRIAGIKDAIGVDACPEMIAAGQAQGLMLADVRALPFPAAQFHMVWCRLVLGHLADALTAYRELARVCRVGGHVFITDFHPDAVKAGGRRSFRDTHGLVHEVEHHVHADHPMIATQTGLALVDRREASVGPAIRDFYARTGRLDMYEKSRGLNVVAAFLFRRVD